MKKPRPRGYYGPDKGKYQKIQKQWARAESGKKQWGKQGNINGGNRGISMVEKRNQ
jgi:hypothetical protein